MKKTKTYQKKKKNPSTTKDIKKDPQQGKTDGYSWVLYPWVINPYTGE